MIVVMERLKRLKKLILRQMVVLIAARHVILLNVRLIDCFVVPPRNDDEGIFIHIACLCERSVTERGNL